MRGDSNGDGGCNTGLLALVMGGARRSIADRPNPPMPRRRNLPALLFRHFEKGYGVVAARCAFRALPEGGPTRASRRDLAAGSVTPVVAAPKQQAPEVPGRLIVEPRGSHSSACRGRA